MMNIMSSPSPLVHEKKSIQSIVKPCNFGVISNFTPVERVCMNTPGSMINTKQLGIAFEWYPAEKKILSCDP